MTSVAGFADATSEPLPRALVVVGVAFVLGVVAARLLRRMTA